MKVEDAFGASMSIAVRRLVEQRPGGLWECPRTGKHVEAKSASARRRNSERKRKGMGPDLHLLLKRIDGQIPPKQLLICGLEKLQTDWIGGVKESIGIKFGAGIKFINGKLLEKEPVQTPFNRVFLGSPGTVKRRGQSSMVRSLRTSVSLVMAKVNLLDRRTIVTNHFPLC